MAAKPHIKDPRFIEVHRLGAMSSRSLDIDVVLDLMIHDLDLILSLVPSTVEGVEAVGVPVLTPKVDIANARLRFANGCIANLTASRISREPVRKIRFFERDAYVSIDTAAKEVEMYRMIAKPGAPPAIGGGKLEVPGDEPLKAELEDFVAAVREGRAPAVSGEQGRAALALANRILELMKQHGH
jgi:predicted dehydrogenase